jgi:hypothetical protein
VFELIVVAGLGALVALVAIVAPVEQCARRGESESEDWPELDEQP